MIHFQTLKLREWLWRKLLPGLMSCRCCESIPRVGGGAEKVNCFVVYLNNEKGESVMLMESYGLHQISGRRLDQHNRFAIHDYFPLYQAIKLEVEITHFYGIHEFVYSRIFDYLLKSYSGWHKLSAIFQNTLSSIFQWVFNRRKLLAGKRFDLLKFLVDKYSNSDGFSIISVMQDKYGYLVFGRPDYFLISEEIESLLNMLVETKDLNRINGNYRVTGQAWQAVSDYQETDRRVSTGNRIQFFIVCLTATIALLTAGQAGIIKFSTLKDYRTEAEKLEDKPKDAVVNIVNIYQPEKLKTDSEKK